jgi:hypothetical protein
MLQKTKTDPTLPPMVEDWLSDTEPDDDPTPARETCIECGERSEIRFMDKRGMCLACRSMDELRRAV